MAVHGSSREVGEVQVGTFFFQDADVQRIVESITANIEPIPLPGFGPDQVLLFDFEGVQNTISLTGQLTVATTARDSSASDILTIEDQKSTLKGFLNGLQLPISFKSTFHRGDRLRW